MPRINVLDTFAIPVPYYDALKDLGTVAICTDVPTADDVTLKRAAGADVLVVNKTRLTAGVIGRLEDSVRLVAETASGYDNIDIAAAAARGITVCNVPGYSTDSVAEHAFALILAVARNLRPAWQQVQEGGWLAEPLMGMELGGRTLGVVGFGRIGRAVCRIAEGFRMRVLVYTGRPEVYRAAHPQYAFVPLDELAAGADIITLHVPHAPATDKLMNAERIGRMKPGAILINTSRGRVVDEAALVAALREGRIRAGLDVVAAEPIAAGHPLIGLPNALVVPHVGWYTEAAVTRLMQVTHDNIAMFYAGRPRNAVTV
jgi:glycerate dehydrogenase